MAEAMDLGKDPNGPTHSSTLFVREDGSAMSFYVRPSSAKRRLSTLILHGGGTVCRVQEPGAVLLAQPGEALAEASGDFISTQYILDCVERNEKLELEAYRLGSMEQASDPKPGASAEGSTEPEPPPLTGRMAYTDADDVAILTYVKENARSPSSVTGNALWKAMEKSSLTQHSWQSLKDRYLKHLRGQEHKYLLGNAPVSPSSQKLKRKAEQDPEAADSGGEACTFGAPGGRGCLPICVLFGAVGGTAQPFSVDGRRESAPFPLIPRSLVLIYLLINFSFLLTGCQFVDWFGFGRAGNLNQVSRCVAQAVPKLYG